MNIGSIQTKHRQDVLTLMQICGIQLRQAYKLYSQSGFNFEKAVNSKFNSVTAPPPLQNLTQKYPPNVFIVPQIDQYAYEDDDIEYMQYKQFRRSGKTFDKKFPVRSTQSFLKTILPSFLRSSDNQEVFKKNLQKYIGRQTNLKPIDGNLSQAFEWCYKQKFPLAIVILNFEPDSRYDVKVLFSDEHLIEKVLCQQFYPYGLNSKEYELEDELKNFINIQRDANSIIICRVTLTDQIQVISRIKIADGLQQIKKKLKQAKSQSIQNEMDESYIIKQYNQQRRGNFNYQRPRTIKQSIKLRQDTKIRKQQQEQFFKAYQVKQEPKKQQIKQKNVENQLQNYNYYEDKQQSSPSFSKSSLNQKLIEQITKQRQEKLSKLPKYIKGYQFKVRVPSGQSILIKVDPQQKVSYIFDFINLQPQELGFNNQIQRKFDIYIGFGGKQTLKAVEKLKIKDTIEDSEVLIVREINQ